MSCACFREAPCALSWAGRTVWVPPAVLPHSEQQGLDDVSVTELACALTAFLDLTSTNPAPLLTPVLALTLLLTLTLTLTLTRP